MKKVPHSLRNHISMVNLLLLFCWFISLHIWDQTIASSVVTPAAIILLGCLAFLAGALAYLLEC